MEISESDLNKISGGGTSADGTKCRVKCGRVIETCSKPNHQKVGESYPEVCGKDNAGAPGFVCGEYQDYICLNCGKMWTEEVK